MVKPVRSRAVKPKVQKGDFAKKKTKIGRKVKRANVTEIKVKSRRIVVPLQNQGVSEDGESNREAINRVIKQLHHYSESTRLNALNRVKDMLNTKIAEESFITLVLPEVIELLFNEEKETRSVVTEVVSLMVAKFPSDAFLPVISVTVTYLCSGLTNIHKGIRKDSLVLLKAMAQKCPVLLAPYLEKLLRHTLLLLTDSFQSVSAPLVQQRDVLVTTGMQVQGKSATASGASGGPAKNITPTMFILILEVLASLLEHGSPRGAAGSSAQSGDQAGMVEFEFNPNFASNAALVLMRFGNPLAVASMGGAQETGTISPSLLLEILQHIHEVWRNLVMNSSALSMDVLSSLQVCTKILLCVSRRSGRASLDDASAAEQTLRFGEVVHTLFAHFPHSCIEASLAPAGSEKDKQGRAKIDQLDVSLCEIAFLHIASLHGAATDSEHVEKLRGVATSYLLQILRAHIEVVSSKCAGEEREAPGEAERVATTKIFKSFELLLSRNTMSALHELLELLGSLFSTLRGVRSSARRSLNYLVVPASECLTCIIDRIHPEIGDEYSEELFLQLVESLEAALSLALAATWDQTALLAKLVSSVLKVLQGKSVMCESPRMLEALGKLSQTYEKIWTPVSTIVPTSSASKGPLFRNSYLTCSEQTKMELLDIFYYASFEDIYSAATQILDFLTVTAGVTLREQAHFLRLLFERRQELGARDFVDLLFSALNSNTACLSDAGAIAPAWGRRWMGHEVAEVLFWMASSESPAKIVMFLSQSMQELVDGACAPSSAPSDEQTVEDSSAVAASGWKQAAVYVLCAQLLVPWMATRRLASASQDVPESDAAAVQQVLRWIATVAVSSLLGPDYSVEQWTALSALMSVQVDLLAPESSQHGFLVYEGILAALSKAAGEKAGDSQALERMLRNLHATMQSRYFDEQLFVQCRVQLAACVDRIVRSASESSAAVDLLKSLAADILALF